MRIVGGTAKGRALEGPKGDGIRPTADRVRQTIFDVLGQRCDGWWVLDLFAGTGALALEAVSRGAEGAVLVDSGREALGLCRQNAEALGFTEKVEIVPAPVARGVESLTKAQRSFDLVFIDPPYAKKLGQEVLATLGPLVRPGGQVLIEHGKHEVLPEREGPFTRTDERRFGETSVTFYLRD